MQETEAEKLTLAQRQGDLLARLAGVTAENAQLQAQLESQVGLGHGAQGLPVQGLGRRVPLLEVRAQLVPARQDCDSEFRV